MLWGQCGLRHAVLLARYAQKSLYTKCLCFTDRTYGYTRCRNVEKWLDGLLEHFFKSRGIPKNKLRYRKGQNRKNPKLDNFNHTHDTRLLELKIRYNVYTFRRILCSTRFHRKLISTTMAGTFNGDLKIWSQTQQDTKYELRLQIFARMNGNRDRRRARNVSIWLRIRIRTYVWLMR